jgi:hypothetical protein
VGNIAGGGAGLLVNLAETLRTAFGQWGAVFRWAFLLGAWGAGFSSLLGVWQSLPYLFTDYLNLSRNGAPAGKGAAVDTASRAYRGSLYALACIPAVGLYLLPFRTAQKTYAIIGALVIPALAAILLYLNNQAGLVGRRYRNSWKTNLVLILTFMFFLFAGWLALGIR